MIRLDDLSTIAENNPTILQDIAKYQGIPIAQLKDAIANHSLSPAQIMPFGKLVLALCRDPFRKLEIEHKLRYAGYSGIRVAIEFNMR